MSDRRRCSWPGDALATPMGACARIDTLNNHRAQSGRCSHSPPAGLPGGSCVRLVDWPFESVSMALKSPMASEGPRKFPASSARSLMDE